MISILEYLAKKHQEQEGPEKYVFPYKKGDKCIVVKSVGWYAPVCKIIPVVLTSVTKTLIKYECIPTSTNISTQQDTLKFKFDSTNNTFRTSIQGSNIYANESKGSSWSIIIPTNHCEAFCDIMNGHTNINFLRLQEEGVDSEKLFDNPNKGKFYKDKDKLIDNDYLDEIKQIIN